MKQRANQTGLTATQVRMARAGASLTVRQLAELAGVNKATIVRIEAGQPTRGGTLDTIRRAFEGLGAEFQPIGSDDKAAVRFPNNSGD